MFYRKNPMNGFAICWPCPAHEIIGICIFNEGDIDYLPLLRAFDENFIDYLGAFTSRAPFMQFRTVVSQSRGSRSSHR